MSFTVLQVAIHVKIFDQKWTPMSLTQSQSNRPLFHLNCEKQKSTSHSTDNAYVTSVSTYVWPQTSPAHHNLDPNLSRGLWSLGL